MGTDTSSSVQLYCLGMRRSSLNFELVTAMLNSNCWASAYSPGRGIGIGLCAGGGAAIGWGRSVGGAIVAA